MSATRAADTTNSNSVSPGNGLNKLTKYLRTGLDGNFYVPGRRIYSKETALCVEQCIAERSGPQAVHTIVRIRQTIQNQYSEAGIFALALCATNEDLKTRQTAYSVLHEACLTPADLFLFVHFVEHLKKPASGWGRAQRRAVCRWYNSREPGALAQVCSRFVSGKGWTHKDLLCLSHLKPTTKEMVVLCKYFMRGLPEALKKCNSSPGDDSGNTVTVPPAVHDLIQFLEAVDQLKHTMDEQLAARLIESHNLVYEHVPTRFHKTREVWAALIPRLHLPFLLQHLPRMCRLGLLRPNSPLVPIILDRLSHDEPNKPQPAQVLIAARKFEDCGKNLNGKPAKHRPNAQLTEALHAFFTASLKALVPTGRRILLAIDVRNTMVHSKCYGSAHISPQIAAAVITLSLVNGEGPGNITVGIFGMRDIVVLEGVNRDTTLVELAKMMRETPMGAVNPWRPMLWARDNNRTFDGFVILTDNQVKPMGDILPVDALQTYRTNMSVPNARMVMCALSLRHFIAADPEDAGMLDIAGFDAGVPRLITDFIAGVF